MYFVKIFDGLHLGDQSAAFDLESIRIHQITRIVNCTVSVPNHWQELGIEYMNFPWYECGQYRVNQDLVGFIDEAITQGEGVLVHSNKGQNRSVFTLAYYLMKKFKWHLVKALQLIECQTRKLDLLEDVISQLIVLQQTLQLSSTNDWNTTSDQDELVLRNTYLNTFTQRVNSKKKATANKSVTFSDNISYIPNYDKILFKQMFSTKKTSIEFKIHRLDIKFEKTISLNKLVNEQYNRTIGSRPSSAPSSNRKRRLKYI